MPLTSIALTAASVLAGFQVGPAARDPGILEDCLVTLIAEAEVPADLPAQEAGALSKLNVSEGDAVSKGDLLGQIDVEMAQKELEASQYRLDVANKEAGNDISVRYANAAAMVAEFEYLKAREANLSEPGVFPAVEVNRLKLQHEQALLQTEQAQHELAIAKVSVKVREAEFAVASHNVERRNIKAPIDGMVVEVYPHEGEWIRPGDRVLRIVRMDRLRVESYIDSTWLSPADVDRKPVTVTVPLPGGRVGTFRGQIVFASPMENAGRKFKVIAEVENQQEANGHWRLRPGMIARMTINWKQ